MRGKLQENPIPVNLARIFAEIKELYGRAPRSRDPEQLFTKQLADCTWEMIRYAHHKTLPLESSPSWAVLGDELVQD